MNDHLIDRPQYMERLHTVRDKELVKVLVGVRRCGKSKLLELFQRDLLRSGVKGEQIQHYGFDDLSNEALLDYRVLNTQVLEKLVPDRMNYIFLDEVQEVAAFEKVVDSLCKKKNVDVYITGPNAHMLSGELATLLSGRYIEVAVYPLSFAEYLPAQAASKQEAFSKYLDLGGFPYVTMIVDERTQKDYLDGIINTVLVKDVLSRKRRSDAILVEQLAKYLTDTSGSLVTIKKIADTLTSQGQKTTSETVLSYLTALQEAYLFYRADRFDIAGKRYLSINSKYYPVDTGLRRSLLGLKRPDFGHRLEGVVYLELLRRGYEIFVGNVGTAEIDFVAMRDGVTEYYQVAATVQDSTTYERETSRLKGIKDNYRKILLTQDEGYFNDNGIEQTNVLEWLLAERR
jgi:predicted AAA+ superfamily ATPase